ncbi:MAG: hypothetical protein ACT4NY_19480 [Pseudonocardiales bacterium]
MGVEKVSASFDLELGAAIRSSASSAGQSVSAWLAEAARARLRLEALAAAVAAWEQDFGPLTEAEVGDADRVLGRAAQQRRKGVA